MKLLSALLQDGLLILLRNFNSFYPSFPIWPLASYSFYVETLLIYFITRSEKRTHSVGFFWTSERPVTEISTDDTQRAQQTNIHAPGGIRNRIPIKRASADNALDRTATGIGRGVSVNENYASAKHFLWICSMFTYFTNMFGVFLLTNFVVDAYPVEQTLTIMWKRCKR
jgi:hypothetical protein